MDAGLAAVLGAVTGAVSTLLASVVTGWSQRAGTRITVRAEHRRDVREVRRTAYRGFLAAAGPVEEMVVNFHRLSGVPLHLFTPGLVSRSEELYRSLDSAWREVVLNSPVEVLQHATAVKEKALDLLTFVKDGASHLERSAPSVEFDAETVGTFLESTRTIEDDMSGFRRQAAEALLDDGTG
ncbi:hypothetical protein ACIGXF_32275 [Streptomyces sp. NPDC053086]|uniref:hypothetical protein n=1 Tax=unclassified Streptomyces TaxID=2593676 RepID=UPI0037D6517C